jgi:Fic family protein
MEQPSDEEASGQTTRRRGPSAPGGWSAVTYESVAWSLSPEAIVSRSARRAHSGPYEASIPASIEQLDHLEIDTRTLALAEEASAEIVRFDAELGGDIAPFASILLRSESAASSQIENLTASAKAIALAELGDPSKRNAGVIVANTRAMEAAIALADHLDEDAIIEMHRVLLGQTHPEFVGHWRTQQVWIKGSDHGPHGAMFVPPHHDRVPTAMHDLVAFMDRDDFPVLAQAAIAHAQFETIHPFSDGNGRTGRSLVHALLRGKGLTRSVTIPVSAGLLTDTDRYFDALTAYREGRPGDIVERLATASFAAVGNGRELVADLTEISEEWNTRVNARSDATIWRILQRLPREPVVDSPRLQRDLELTAPTVNAAIDQLADLGILHKIRGNHRYRKWAAIEVLDALDQFAVRAGRRTRGT